METVMAIRNEKPMFGTTTAGSTERKPYPNVVKVEPIHWPTESEDRIQQTKTGSKPQVQTLPGTARPRVNARTVPRPVNNVRINRAQAGANQHKVTVSFIQHPSDIYFQRVAVYLKQGNGEPTQVAGGSTSPISFTTNKTSAPSQVMVQSVGAWGATPIHRAPSHIVHLG